MPCETYQVGLTTISLDEDPQALSGGFKRRLALAIQLVLYIFFVYYELMFSIFSLIFFLKQDILLFMRCSFFIILILCRFKLLICCCLMSHLLVQVCDYILIKSFIKHCFKSSNLVNSLISPCAHVMTGVTYKCRKRARG